MHGFAVTSMKYPTEEQKPAVKAINDLFNAVKNEPSLKQGPFPWGEYGLKDVDEFVGS